MTITTEKEGTNIFHFLWYKMGTLTDYGPIYGINCIQTLDPSLSRLSSVRIYKVHKKLLWPVTPDGLAWPNPYIANPLM